MGGGGRAVNDRAGPGEAYPMHAAGRAAGADLTGFFTAWGLRPDETVRPAR